MSILDKINSKTSIGTRLALMSGVFVVSSAVVTSLLVGNALEAINFSKKEDAGAQYLPGVWNAVRGNGGVDVQGADQFNASAAATAFAAAQTDDERYRTGLTLITAIADGSNLTLDPDLDSFYAMDAATVKIPALLVAAIELEQATETTDLDERAVMIGVRAARLQSVADAAKTSLEAAMANNASGETRQALAETVSLINSATGELIARARAVAPGQDLEPQHGQFEAMTDTVWGAANDELGRLLEQRVQRDQRELTMQLALVAMFLAVAGALAFLVSTGLARRMKGITETMDRLREGDFRVEVPFTSDGHETGKIANTLEVLRDGIAKRVEDDARRLEEMQLGAEGIIAAISRAQAVIEFKPDGTIVAANENFLKATGYSLQEIVGQHHAMFAPPDYARSPDYRAFWDKLNRGEFVADKFMHLGNGGKEVWLQVSYNPIADKTGKVVKVVKFATDITQQEKAAREANVQSAALNASSSAVMTIDRDFKITYINEATRKLLRELAPSMRQIWPGFNPDALVGQCIDQFHKHPAHQRQLLADPTKLPHKADINVGEHKIELNVGGIFDDKRQLVGHVLGWEDVTAKRLNAGMLDALGQSQAIIEFNLDGAIVNANENFCQATGYSLDEIKGKHHSMFVENAYRQSSEYRGFWEALARGEAQSDKFQRIAKGGREIWLQAIYSPILDGNGKPFKVVKIATDVTQAENDRKAADAERAARAEEQARVVRGLADGLGHLAEGDLTARIGQPFPGEYEKLRTDFNDAMGTLQEAMKAIVVNSGGIRSGAGEISQASDDLSRRTEQQAASLEQTAAALDEITATVRKTAEGSKQANGVVATTRSDAEASGNVVQETVAAMAEIEKSSKQISQIIGVIDEIAFQTNLLALNAGVEAARAGDAGRGFAVVASEVRALAQRSSEAAKEIKGLISASSGHVETGVELVGQAGKALRGIVTKVNEISGLVSEIAASAQEQATALAEVNTAINQMDQVTQQNAAMVEESTAASHSLTQEAEELMGLIARFQTGVATTQVKSPPQRTKAAGQPVHQQRQRVAQFASSSAAAAVKDDDWQEF